jgi:hypothetical protein
VDGVDKRVPSGYSITELSRFLHILHHSEHRYVSLNNYLRLNKSLSLDLKNKTNPKSYSRKQKSE